MGGIFSLHLANSTKLCYADDNLNRVTKRTVKNLSDVVLSAEICMMNENYLKKLWKKNNAEF